MVEVLLAPVVGGKGVHVGEHADHGVAHLARDEVAQRDEHRVARLDHVEDLVLHVVDLAIGLVAKLGELVGDRAEEDLDVEGCEAAHLFKYRMSSSFKK